MKPYLKPIIVSRRHLVEMLAEAKNFNATLREWKRVKHAYKLADGTYLFSWIPYTPDESHCPIDFDSIEKEARDLRKKFKKMKKIFR